MTSAPLLSGRRRLLALCAVSLLLHVGVLAWIAHRAPRLPPSGGDAGALVLRVRVAQTRVQATAAQARAAAVRAPARSEMRTAAHTPSAAPPAASRPTTIDAAAGTNAAAVAAAGAAADANPDAADLAAAGAGAAANTPNIADTITPALSGSPTLPPELLFGAPQVPLDSARQRYRVRMPPSTQIDYAVTQSAPGAAPHAAAGASLTWRSAVGGYRVQLDGVPTADGRRDLASSGVLTDVGMAPLDPNAAAPRAAQDEASMLMLLASMGMEDPGQLQDEVRIRVEVDGVDAVLGFKAIGQERIASGIGPLDTLRLAQVSGPGNARLEVWLAPARNWMPVQLRDTWADGSVATRLVQRMAPPN